MHKVKIITRYRKYDDSPDYYNGARSVERRKIKEKYPTVGKIKQTIIKTGNPDNLGEIPENEVVVQSEFEVENV